MTTIANGYEPPMASLYKRVKKILRGNDEYDLTIRHRVGQAVIGKTPENISVKRRVEILALLTVLSENWFLRSSFLAEQFSYDDIVKWCALAEEHGFDLTLSHILPVHRLADIEDRDAMITECVERRYSRWQVEDEVELILNIIERGEDFLGGYDMTEDDEVEGMLNETGS